MERPELREEVVKWLINNGWTRDTTGDFYWRSEESPPWLSGRIQVLLWEARYVINNDASIVKEKE